MEKIVLQSVLLNDTISDIVIDGNRFSEIVPSKQCKQYDNAELIDCSGLAILPAFYNAHTHAAMTLVRGYADDTPLFEWLNDYIWPFEAKLTAKDIEIGSRLAVLEMIKSGTVFFSDMYWHREATMKVVEEMGIRAAIGVTISDVLTSPKDLEENFTFLKQHKGESERVKLVVMPHAIYTNTDECFKRSIAIAKEENYVLHTHLSETSKEVNDCLLQYKCTPVELMEKWGALSSHFVAAHCVHFTEKDKNLFSQAGAIAVMNPCSNLKLGSGIPNIVSLLKNDIMVALGTDGASSNNNLDMREEMKLAGLLTKANDASVIVSKNDILKLATENGAKAYGISDAGRIEEGWLADCILIRMDNERMVPCHDIVSNWIYGADSRAIDSVMCNGKFVMRSGYVDGEDDIVAEAVSCVKRLM